MKNQRILITEPIIESVIDQLRNDFTVDVGRRGQFNSEASLIEVIEPYDAILPMLSNPITARVMKAAPNLKIIANHAVGFNNIDVEAAQKAGIHVANTPGVLTEACADFTMTLLLAVARRVKEAEQYLREGSYQGWEPLGFLGTELHGCSLGILGMGRIGCAVARRAHAFGMKISYHNRHRLKEEREQELHATYINSVQKLASQSQILSIHCPLTQETRSLLNANLIATMPKDAIIINTARGQIIDEQALAEALHEGHLAGAGLDVFENEPAIDPLLLNAPNCVLTPHMASATHQTRKAIGDLAADAIRGVLMDKPRVKIPNLLTV